jgi:hypothetical protein
MEILDNLQRRRLYPPRVGVGEAGFWSATSI